MMISATLLDRTGEIRPFALFQPNMELSFDILNRFIREGDTLLKVAILDEGRWTPLSVESFDGKPCLEAIAQIAGDWQQILRQPAISRYRIDILAASRIERHRVCIRQLERVIGSAEQRLQRVKQAICREPQRSKTLELLKNVLDQYEHNLLIEQLSLHRFLEQLPERIAHSVRPTAGGLSQ